MTSGALPLTYRCLHGVLAQHVRRNANGPKTSVTGPRPNGRTHYGRCFEPGGGLPPESWRAADSCLSLSSAWCLVPPELVAGLSGDRGGRFSCRLPVGDGFGGAGGEDRLELDRWLHLTGAVAADPVVAVDVAGHRRAGRRPWWRSDACGAARTRSSSGSSPTRRCRNTTRPGPSTGAPRDARRRSRTGQRCIHSGSTGGRNTGLLDGA